MTRDAVLTAKIAEGRFPRHREVWPTGEVKAELRLDDARTLGDFVGTAVAATDCEHKGVEMVLAGGCLMMTVESGTKGKAVLSLLVPDSEGKATFELDALMFRQFLDAAGNERLRLRFYGAGEPLVLPAGPDYEFVLMPLSRDKPAPPGRHPGRAAPEDEGEGEGNPPTATRRRPRAVVPAPEPAPVARGPRRPTPTGATARPGPRPRASRDRNVPGGRTYRPPLFLRPENEFFRRPHHGVRSPPG